MKKYFSVGDNVKIETHLDNVYIGYITFVNNSVISIKYYDYYFKKMLTVTFEGYKKHKFNSLDQTLISKRYNALGELTGCIEITL